MVSYW